jgi:hypothetical protein
MRAQRWIPFLCLEEGDELADEDDESGGSDFEPLLARVELPIGQRLSKRVSETIQDVYVDGGKDRVVGVSLGALFVTVRGGIRRRSWRPVSVWMQTNPLEALEWE